MKKPFTEYLRQHGCPDAILIYDHIKMAPTKEARLAEWRKHKAECPQCANASALYHKAWAARINRQARESAYRDCGLVKVRGALGGIYWE